jgi:hypothetical protein
MPHAPQPAAARAWRGSNRSTRHRILNVRLGRSQRLGVDWFDIRFRLERRFGVGIEYADFDHLTSRGRADLTAGDLYEVLCKRIRAVGRRVPYSCWNGLRRDLAEALNVSPFSIRQESRLARDLGME